ncbi:MAG: hypothetical protein PSX42_11205 [bacterium]|nr:hypothetical protein [bacterium]
MDFSEFLTDVLAKEPKTHTESGKQVSQFTMTCVFNVANPHSKWTYRGDQTLLKYQASGSCNIKNELEALILKAQTIKENIKSCKIYNNKNGMLNQLIFDQSSDGRININRLHDELAKLMKR